MSRFSENEREIFQSFLADFDLRNDGRSKLQPRHFKVEYNNLPSTYSSLRLIYSNKSKEIIFAIKVNYGMR
jgi:exosome complex RNA-binding protein Rrp42 (RNase PH superfamily)